MVKLRGGGRSEHLEDRRGRGGLALGGGAAGIIVLVLTLLLGGGGGGGGPSIEDVFSQIQGAGSAGTIDPADEPLVDEMSAALDDIQEHWQEHPDVGRAYRPATLVLYTSGVTTEGCGNASSAVGPFYCPADEHAYLDLSFFRELSDRFDAPGDFARVYVLAHELGHHVQNLLGDNARVRQEQDADPGRANELSVRLELQADCYAGIWAHSAQDRGLIEPGDIDEGLAAAAAVGDDRLSGGAADRDSWTHGSSESRQRWFRAGFDAGTVRSCDTFAASVSDLGL